MEFRMKRYAYIIAAMLVVVCSNMAMAERLVVAVDVANIRSGPGTTFDIIWKVGKYHPLNITDKSGPWYHFRDFEGDQGWIHKSLIREIPSIITNQEECNIRSGPGTSFKTLFTVEKGIPFRVLNQKGNWIHIEHSDGDQGWIHKSLVW
ncbi:MAG: SH3 domain-containing protein [Desulfobacterales bacterium]|uniref:SH3 domain-containing protein n=1 Tax=Candidatus Desulfatibia profunda TaxID=2841695 RepID=A0A8J6THM1_9BACT|nr:SH3 domain-containing protein [Candidatus Desulfatibia profunda]MBL7179568.1 SH3 domain-containing protein [Desulfobacterales bacterium]MBU0698339.1 SH3 domain-containing protein [Pseudomonadota bacterium]